MGKHFIDHDDLANGIQQGISKFISVQPKYEKNKYNVVTLKHYLTIRTRVTDGQLTLTNTKSKHFDFLVGETEDGFVLLEHDESNFYDYFNGTAFKEDDTTSAKKCTILSFDNLIGVLLALIHNGII